MNRRPTRRCQPKGWLQSMGGATPFAGCSPGAAGGGGSPKDSPSAAATPALSSSTGVAAGTRTRSSSVGASGSLRTGLASNAAAVPLARSSQALTRRLTSRFGISDRDAWLRTPPATMAHSLQSGRLAPNGYTRQSSQYSRPQRRHTFSAPSKLWSWQRPVSSAITGQSPRRLPLPSARTPHFLKSPLTNERVFP